MTLKVTPKSIGSESSALSASSAFMTLIKAVIELPQPTKGWEVDNEYVWSIYEQYLAVEHIQKTSWDLQTVLSENNQLKVLYESIASHIIPEMIIGILAERKKTEKNVRDLFSTDPGQWLIDVVEGEKTLFALPFVFNVKNTQLHALLEEALKDEIKTTCENAIQKIQEKLNQFVTNDTYENIKNIIWSMESNDLLSSRVATSLKGKLMQALIEKTQQELSSRIKEFSEKLNIAEKNSDIFVDLSSKEDIKQWIRNMQDSIVWGSDHEQALQSLTTDFEQTFQKDLTAICSAVLHNRLIPRLQECEQESAVHDFEGTNSEYIERNKKLDILTESKEHLLQVYAKQKKDILVDMNLRIPKVRVHSEVVYFWSEAAAINRADSSSKKQAWDIEPAEKDGNIITSFKKRVWQDTIKPSLKKQLGGFASNKRKVVYKYTPLEREDIIKKHQALRDDEDFLALREKRSVFDTQLKQARVYATFVKQEQSKESQKDNTILFEEGLRAKERVKELQKSRVECNSDISKKQHVLFTIKDILNRFDDVPMGEVPSLHKNIVITPQIMDDLEAFARLCNTQLLRQDGIATLEWEAGVGKNVLIDIYAHYTNRKVFTFPCNKRASKEDLTYQRLIAENGTYKLHSKVYEAITTPGAILVFDEINTLPGEVVKLLNGLFDYRRTLTMPYDSEHVKAGKDLLIIGTQNPTHYIGTEKKPQDTTSRESVLVVDYPVLHKKISGEQIVWYDDALKTYINSPFYYKFLHAYTKEKIDEVKLLMLKEINHHILTKEQKKQIEDMSNATISQRDFVILWQEILNKNNSAAIEAAYGEGVVQGIKDIYTLLLYTEYVRERYKNKMTWVWLNNRQDKISVSVSQRELNKMMSEMEHSKTPKDAFMSVYLPLIQDVSAREQIRQDIEGKDFVG